MGLEEELNASPGRYSGGSKREKLLPALLSCRC